MGCKVFQPHLHSGKIECIVHQSVCLPARHHKRRICSFVSYLVGGNFAAPHRQGRTRPGQTRTEDIARMTCTTTSACLLYHAHQAGGRRVVFYLWSPTGRTNQVASRRQWGRLISTEFGMWERQDLWIWGRGESFFFFFFPLLFLHLAGPNSFLDLCTTL